MAFIYCLSGQNIEKNIHYGKRILDALIDIVQGVSFIECTEECFSRRRCLSVNYWRSILLCEMNSVDQSSHLLSDEPKTVFADISLLEQHFVGGCRNHKCAINMKCVPGPFGTHRCEIQVIQRRCFDNTNFYRTWPDYKDGFGNFKEKTDFWIGNDVIHMLTKNGYTYMRVEMLKTDNEPLEAEYSHFFVGDESTKYNLTIRGFKGLYVDVLDCMTNKDYKQTDANGMKFSTFDNDKRNGCADYCRSGWWFHSCTCGNVNGLFGNKKTASVMRWMCKDGWNCPLKATRILLRV
ncbi:fibrinogen-like protein 1 [Saccostrea cucullata]|uniref:fibrinogen-like protein 1 n=1 Tax=Saccostrea cuccullata TaxID=36930 RepID=UPI002ED23CE8